jgi:hypothetical protein
VRNVTRRRENPVSGYTVEADATWLTPLLASDVERINIVEAAHISPYRGASDNNPQNGLLLRADIHTLFDLNLLGIEPNTLQVVLHPKLANDEQYRGLAGRTLMCEGGKQPNDKALQLRYKQFRVQRN